MKDFIHLLFLFINFKNTEKLKEQYNNYRYDFVYIH